MLLASARWWHNKQKQDEAIHANARIRPEADKDKTPKGKYKKRWQSLLDGLDKELREYRYVRDEQVDAYKSAKYNQRLGDRGASQATLGQYVDQIDRAILSGALLGRPEASIKITDQYAHYVQRNLDAREKKGISNKDLYLLNYDNLVDPQRGCTLVWDLTQSVDLNPMFRELYEDVEVWEKDTPSINKRKIHFHLQVSFNGLGEPVHAKIYTGTIREDILQYPNGHWAWIPIDDSFGQTFIDYLNFSATGSKSDNEARAFAAECLLATDLRLVFRNLTPAIPPVRRDAYDGGENEFNEVEMESLYLSNKEQAEALIKQQGLKANVDDTVTAV